MFFRDTHNSFIKEFSIKNKAVYEELKSDLSKSKVLYTENILKYKKELKKDDDND